MRVQLKGKIGACVHQLAGKATLGQTVGLDGLRDGKPAAPLIAPDSVDPVAESNLAERMADEVYEVDSLSVAERGVLAAVADANAAF